MLKLIKCEFYKFKRRSLFVLATLVALVFPVVMTALYWNIPTQVNYDNLFSGIVDYGDFLLLLPILVIIATSLFFTETDRNNLTYTCNQSLDLSILRRGEWSRS